MMFGVNPMFSKSKRTVFDPLNDINYSKAFADNLSVEK
jgi:hypothetical protein